MGADQPQITILPIESIKPYGNNAKLHPPEQINQIAASIQAFGNNDPIAVDEDNIIIEGHGRLLALKQLGYKEIEVIRLTHMTEDQKRAYILIHNQLTMNTDFDYNILDAELARIDDIDMTDFGFETIEVSPMDYDTDFTLGNRSAAKRETEHKRACILTAEFPATRGETAVRHRPTRSNKTTNRGESETDPKGE